MKIYRTSALERFAFLFLFSLLVTGTDAVAEKKGQGNSGLLSNSISDAEATALELGKSKSTKAVGTLLDGLAIGVHPRVAIAALDALAKHGEEVAFDTLAFYLKNRNTLVRISALKAMSVLKNKEAKALTLAALGDANTSVRATAIEIAMQQKNRLSIGALIELLKKGEKASVPALSAMADNKNASDISKLFGVVPDNLLASCLGGILMRPDFKSEDARVEVVKAIGLIPGSVSIEQLTNYLGAIPKKPPRASRKEAEAIVDAKLGG